MTMMREIFIFIIVLLAIFAKVSKATQVSDCVSGDNYEDPNQVKITACNSPPCRLKQGTKIGVEQHFTPDKDIESLTTMVQAQVGILSLPFVGVSGTNACDLIYKPDGTKAGCPLKKGQEYVYKNSFPVLAFYPRISTSVRWALAEGKNEITCFEVPAKIVA